jgi:hypothetical protein
MGEGLISIQTSPYAGFHAETEQYRTFQQNGYTRDAEKRTGPTLKEVLNGLWAALTVPQIAAMTGRLRRTIFRRFHHEPGVWKFVRPERKHKRRYRTLRIPRAVYDRVIATKKLC